MKKTILWLTYILIFTNLNAQSYLTRISFPDTSSSLSLRTRNFIKTDNQNNTWMGFGGEWLNSTSRLVSPIGLIKYNNGTWNTYNKNNSNIGTNDITCIDFQNNNVWIGSNSGVIKFDGNTFYTYNISNSNILSDSIKDISVNGNTIWIATNKGVSKLDGNSFTNYNTTNSSLISNSINCITSVSNSTAYIGTPNGLVYFQNNAFVNFTKSNSGLLSNNITTLHLDKNNILWIGGDSCIVNGAIITGLHYLKNGTIKNLSLENLNVNNCEYVLPSFCKSIVSDDLGQIYFTNSNNNNSEELIVYKYFNNNLQVSKFAITDFKLMNKYGLIALDSKKRVIVFNSSYKGGIQQLNIINLDSTNISINKNTKYLNINQVSAPINAENNLINWDTDNNRHYEVPKGSCKNTIFTSGLWIGGIANGQLHLSAQTYRQSGTDFYPGPIDTFIINKTDSVFQGQVPNNYKQAWKINRFDIEAFKLNFSNGNVTNGNYKIPEDILNWPAIGTGNYTRNLTPFFDNDKDGLYNPNKGDYPIIKGDQMVYWIANDNGLHGESQGRPLGIEVHGYTYAYVCNNFTDNNDSSIINYTTFTELEIINKSNRNYDSVRIGNWLDNDIGSFKDDYIGCNPKENYSYAYNGDEVDEGPNGYGINPPVSSTLFLTTPENNNKEVGFGKFVYYSNDFTQQGNPSTATHYWNYLNGLWKDNQPITYGGTGRGGTDTASFMFCGDDDLAGRPRWDEVTAGNVPGDRRCLNVTNAFTFKAGETKKISYATIHTRANRNNWKNQMAKDISLIKNWSKSGTYPSCLNLNIGINNVNYNNNSFPIKLYPNPNNGYFTIDFNKYIGNKSIAIFDIQGKEIKIVKTTETEISIDLKTVSKGIYFIKIQIENGTIFNSKVVID